MPSRKAGFISTTAPASVNRPVAIFTPGFAVDYLLDTALEPALTSAIVFNGDVMNTAARLEQLSRDMEGGFLASAADRAAGRCCPEHPSRGAGCRSGGAPRAWTCSDWPAVAAERAQLTGHRDAPSQRVPLRKPACHSHLETVPRRPRGDWRNR